MCLSNDGVRVHSAIRKWRISRMKQRGKWRKEESRRSESRCGFRASHAVGSSFFRPSADGSVQVFSDWRPVISQLQPLGGEQRGGGRGRQPGDDRGNYTGETRALRFSRLFQRFVIYTAGLCRRSWKEQMTPLKNSHTPPLDIWK